MSRDVYVGQLPYAATADEVRTLFERYGPVLRVYILTDHLTGRSKGCGFVTLAQDEDAENAIQRLHGTEYRGRTLTVTVPRSQRGVR